MYDWYYASSFGGQLGPLSYEQMLEFVEDKVVEEATYVWKVGMPAWVHAGSIPDFRARMAPPGPPPLPAERPAKARSRAALATEAVALTPGGPAQMPAHSGLFSPCSRIVAACLQLLPGVGRMYLGYLAIGILQLFLALCSGGLLAAWSWLDGYFILSGRVEHDGYGRVLRN